MGVVEHAERKHALLSASGASRWLNCTPSARLEEKFDESTSSAFAEEGTLAHEFGDLELNRAMGLVDPKVYKAELKKLQKNNLYTDEMEGEVYKYTSYVVEALNVARQTTPDAVLLIEERLDFSYLVEAGFGTGDAVIVADSVAEIIDLKYGKGIRVDAKENSQLMLYGIGALRSFDLSFDIKTIKLTIVQPRLDHVSSWEISAEDLIKWGEEVVKVKAVEAYKGAGDQCAGDWCKWCKVKGMCAALAAKNVELARFDFEEPKLLDDESLLNIYKQIPMLVDWAKAVGDHILREAVRGKAWDGYKVVEGKSNRKWGDESKVIEVLEAEGKTRDEFTTTKLKGLGDIEKLIGKALFTEKLSPFVDKPIGAPTLAPLSDSRKAMNGLDQAKMDFSVEV